MLKILHIAPENYTGILMDYVRAHRAMGNQSHLVTFFRCVNQYEEDLCLNLPLVGKKKYIGFLKNAFLPSGKPAIVPAPTAPQRVPGGIGERAFFAFRDWLWEPRVRRLFDQQGFWDYDFFHLEGGVEFLRNCRIVRELKDRGKKIVCNYHGLDLRVRGLIPKIDELSDLNLTCEFDLLALHPRIRYLFLPFNTTRVRPRQHENNRLRICHAPRSRAYKGTAEIVPIVQAVAREHPLELVLIENKSHAETMEIKSTCDIAIDQMVEGVHAEGGTGYGVNSLETLALGIPTCTNLTPEYETFIPDHPFIIINRHNLRAKLIELITNRDYRREKAAAGRAWVVKYHDALNVVRQLYGIYRELGWITNDGQLASLK
jgi:hypothetical protein